MSLPPQAAAPDPAEGPVRLFMAADRTVFRHVPAVVNSARAVTSRPIELGLVTQGVSEAEWDRLRAKFPGLSIRCFALDAAALGGLHHKASITSMAYARLFMPDLVDWPRYVYLDTDVLVLRDLAELHDTDLGGRPAAGVFEREGRTRFNGGVLLVDAEAWRRRGLGETMLDYARTHRPQEADQDCILAVIGPELLALDRSWNRTIAAAWGPPIEDPERLLAEAAVLHFVIGFKPWNLGRRYIPRAILAVYDAHADAAGLPRHWSKEAWLLAWQLRALWRTRHKRRGPGAAGVALGSR